MAIYKPELFLTEADRETLALLGHLAVSAQDSNSCNLPQEVVPLTPIEAARLLTLLEQFVSSKLFLEGSYFVEGIGNGEADVDDRLKGIYISWRSRRGFTNVLSNQRWREFVLRAGFNSSENGWMWSHNLQRSPLRPMDLKHFAQMEARLSLSAGLHPRVQNLIQNFIELSIPTLLTLRNR